MSDDRRRGISGPPARPNARPGGVASSLVRSSRADRVTPPPPPADVEPDVAPVEPARVDVAPDRAPAASVGTVATPVAPATTEAAPEPQPRTQAVTPVEPVAESTQASVTEAPARSRAAKKPSITVELPADLRERARAVFRHTKHLEGPEFFNELIAELLERECERREQLYNNGERFLGGERPLPRGRPFG